MSLPLRGGGGGGADVKKLVISLVLLALVTLAACNKSKEVISPVPKDVAPSPKAVARLQTQDEFFNLLDKIDKMKEEELNEWEKTRNFTSYRTVWKQAQVEWDSLRTEAGEAAFLKKYSDILELKDNSIEPLIKSRFYQAICNRNGIFATSHGLTRIYGDYCLNDSTGNYAKLMSVTEQSHGAVRYSQEISRTIWTPHHVDLKLFEKELASVVYDKWNGCGGESRRIRFSVSTHNYFFYLGANNFTCQHRLDFHAEAFEIRWWGCSWVRYKTEIKFRNLQSRFVYLQQNIRSGYSGCTTAADVSLTESYVTDQLGSKTTPPCADQEEMWHTVNMSNVMYHVAGLSYATSIKMLIPTTDVHGSGEASTRGVEWHWVPISF